MIHFKIKKRIKLIVGFTPHRFQKPMRCDLSIIKLFFSKHLLPILIPLFFMNKINAQDLSIHQWENRLVLVLTEDSSSFAFKKQLKEFRLQEEGMQERKILVYQIMPQQFLTGLKESNMWQVTNTLFKKYKQKDAELEIILIGLDGGVKLRQTEFLSCEKLFTIIDGMPMRRAEMIRKKN